MHINTHLFFFNKVNINHATGEVSARPDITIKTATFLRLVQSQCFIWPRMQSRLRSKDKMKVISKPWKRWINGQALEGFTPESREHEGPRLNPLIMVHHRRKRVSKHWLFPDSIPSSITCTPLERNADCRCRWIASSIQVYSKYTTFGNYTS